MNALILAAALAASNAQYERVPSLPGWWATVRVDPSKATVERDDAVLLGGQPTARLKNADPGGGWIDIEQSVDGLSYRGKRVRLAAEARTESVTGWTGLSVRVDGFKGIKSKDNTQHRALKGTMAWTPVEVVFDVAEDAQQIILALSQDGTGTSWFGRVRFEVVDKSVPLTRVGHPGLANGSFEDGTQGWFLSGGGRNDYVQTLVSDVQHSGASALKLTLAPEGDKKKYGTTMQFFDADAFIGKRVRASVWVKSQGATGRADFWTRVQAHDSPGDGPGLGGGYSHLETDADWTEYVSVFDVPEGAAQLNFGVGLAGPGTVWIDDATFTVVPKETPLRWGASLAPRNLNFSGR
jgi:hypothetical protein